MYLNVSIDKTFLLKPYKIERLKNFQIKNKIKCVEYKLNEKKNLSVRKC